MIVGGITSRFWLFRKHMNTIPPRKYRVLGNDVPFYAWQCLTLQMHNRDINLIIKNERHMIMFIKYICYQINSINGQRDSGLAMQQRLFDKCFKQMSEN